MLKLFVIPLGQQMPLIDKLIQTLNLGDTQGRLQIGHAIIEAKVDLLVVPGPIHFMRHQMRFTGDTVAAQKPHFLGQLRVIGNRHATLSRRDDLDRMEAEYRDVAVAAPTDVVTLVFPPNRVRGIFNDLESILMAQRANRTHVARLPREMHRHHHFGQCAQRLGLFQFLFKTQRAEIVAFRVNIDEVDPGPTVQRTVCRSDKCIRGRPQPIPCAQLQRQARDMQRRGGTIGSQRITGTTHGFHSIFELRNSRALGEIR